MSDAPVSDGFRRAGAVHADHATEVDWMREHHRSPEWIDAALERDLTEHGAAGAALCHVIGEHLRPEPDSPLGEFVVYDILRPRAVLAQLAHTPAVPREASWVTALRDFARTAEATGWTGREETGSPRPMLYVARSGAPVGHWVDMTRPERHVQACLDELPGDPRDTELQVHGRMGFYDVYPFVQPELWTMHVVGQGIDRHGEAFAAYAEHTFQQAMTEHDFEARYRGHVTSLDEFVLDQAEERGWLAALSRLNQIDGLAGAVRLDMEALRRHVFSTGYAYEPGREGYHVFGPPTL